MERDVEGVLLDSIPRIQWESKALLVPWQMHQRDAVAGTR
jgi:hypothetical protein